MIVIFLIIILFLFIILVIREKYYHFYLYSGRYPWDYTRTPPPYNIRFTPRLRQQFYSQSNKLHTCLRCRRQGLCVRDLANGLCGKCNQSDLLFSCHDKFGTIQ